MPGEYHSIKWNDKKTFATRRTREVSLACKIIERGMFLKDGESIPGITIRLVGTGDCTHHLVEDAAILLSKMAEELCGPGHDKKGK